MEEQKASNSVSLFKHYEYDAMGNCVSTTDIYGKQTSSEYDCLGRLIKTSYPGIDATQPQSTINYKHDAMGRVNSITDAKGETISIKYNIRGKPICKTFPDGSSEKQTYTILGRTC